MSLRFAAAALVGLFAANAHAVQVRYFLSLNGLTNPADTDSAAVSAATINGDVAAGGLETIDVHAGNYRFYVWAMLPSTPTTDLLGFNLAFRTTGDVTIQRTNLWQNTNGFVDPDSGEFIETYRRWEDGGFPGLQNWNAQSADPTPTVAVLTDGVTNQTSALDDQRRNVTFPVGSPANNQRAIVVGYIEVSGITGYVHIINEGSGFLQLDPNNRVFLGLDDMVGAPAEVPGQPYDNLSFEAAIGVPEPTTLALLSMIAAMTLRRR